MFWFCCTAYCTTDPQQVVQESLGLTQQRLSPRRDASIISSADYNTILYSTINYKQSIYIAQRNKKFLMRCSTCPWSRLVWYSSDAVFLLGFKELQEHRRFFSWSCPNFSENAHICQSSLESSVEIALDWTVSYLIKNL